MLFIFKTKIIYGPAPNNGFGHLLLLLCLKSKFPHFCCKIIVFGTSDLWGKSANVNSYFVLCPTNFLKQKMASFFDKRSKVTYSICFERWNILQKISFLYKFHRSLQHLYLFSPFKKLWTSNWNQRSPSNQN